MVALADVKEFCNQLSSMYYFGFTSQQTPKGVAVWGETTTPKGEYYAISLDVKISHVDVKVYNRQRALLYSGVVKDSISSNVKLKNKLRRILM